MAEVDYHTECGALPLSFIQLWAATIVGYHDLPGIIHYRFNALGTSGNCSGIRDFITCPTSHVDSERQLVENVFALDDCSRLAMKFFASDDTHWVDYSNCGELPQTFLQMLARCIITYVGATTENRINAITAENDCAHITDLYSCSTYSLTDEIAELILVSNIFATDDCGHLLIKLFNDTSTMTDFHTECTQLPHSFIQLLARCVVRYEGHYYLNTAFQWLDEGDCDYLHDFWTCTNNHINPERALTENLFCTDSCNHLAIKIFTNGGRRQ